MMMLSSSSNHSIATTRTGRRTRRRTRSLPRVPDSDMTSSRRRLVNQRGQCENRPPPPPPSTRRAFPPKRNSTSNTASTASSSGTGSSKSITAGGGAAAMPPPKPDMVSSRRRLLVPSNSYKVSRRGEDDVLPPSLPTTTSCKHLQAGRRSSLGGSSTTSSSKLSPRTTRAQRRGSAEFSPSGSPRSVTNLNRNRQRPSLTTGAGPMRPGSRSMRNTKRQLIARHAMISSSTKSMKSTTSTGTGRVTVVGLALPKIPAMMESRRSMGMSQSERRLNIGSGSVSRIQPHHQQQRPGLVHNNKVRGGSRRLSQRSIKVATTTATSTSTRSMKSYNSVQTQNSILFHIEDDEDDLNGRDMMSLYAFSLSSIPPQPPLPTSTAQQEENVKMEAEEKDGVEEGGEECECPVEVVFMMEDGEEGIDLDLHQDNQGQGQEEDDPEAVTITALTLDDESVYLCSLRSIPQYVMLKEPTAGGPVGSGGDINNEDVTLADFPDHVPLEISFFVDDDEEEENVDDREVGAEQDEEDVDQEPEELEAEEEEGYDDVGDYVVMGSFRFPRKNKKAQNHHKKLQPEPGIRAPNPNPFKAGDDGRSTNNNNNRRRSLMNFGIKKLVVSFRNNIHKSRRGPAGGRDPTISLPKTTHSSSSSSRRDCGKQPMHNESGHTQLTSATFEGGFGSIAAF